MPTASLVRVLIVAASMSDIVSQPPPREPSIIRVAAESAATDPSLRALIEDLRAQADAFVFLAGGAAKMTDEDQRRLLTLFDALGLVARGGTRLAVGDGGTQAGIMEAAGRARQASGGAFLLLGIPPAAEIPPRGQTPIDPQHSHIIAVDNRAWDGSHGAWGSETATMYEVFARLASGRPSVAIVANGGAIVLNEVEANVRAGRPMILIAGSGRATDALVSLLDTSAPALAPAPGELADLRAEAAARGLTTRPELFHVLPLAGASAESLARLLTQLLADGRRTPAAR